MNLIHPRTSTRGWQRSMRFLFPLIGVLCLMFISAPKPTSAHPLGEASVSKYSALQIGRDRVEILYVVDMGEVPAFQELGTIRSDRSTDLTVQQRDDYIARKSVELLANLSLTVDGKEIELKRTDAGLSFPPGNGGLPTLRLEMRLTGEMPGAASGTIIYRDGNYNERKGWKEIIANPMPGTVLESSDVPTQDQTRGLTQYNLEITSSAPSKTEATIKYAQGDTALGGTIGPQQSSGQPGANAPGERGDFFSNILSDKELPLVFALILAFVAGAGHALSPGHGKTVVAAYLVGTRGTPKQAAFLGLTVTISHTIGVFVLGIIVLSLQQYILPETVAPFLGFASGLLIMLVGIVLFVQRLRYFRNSRTTSVQAAHNHDHDHSHDHSHDHDHDHSHDHTLEHTHDHADASVPHSHGPFGKPHTHLPADGQKVTLGSLLALGITGGIIPCPSALVVLLAAVYFNQVAYGLLLIVAFSLGLASVLTGLGLLVVYGRNMLSRSRFSERFKFGNILGRLPMASALVVTCLGFIIAYSALSVR